MTTALQPLFTEVLKEIAAAVPGQRAVVERLIIAVLSDGHVLLEGPPGVAKTRAALLLAHAFKSSFARIQFTPDLLPSDLIGTNIYDPNEHRFEFHKGPLFHGFILADEINRAPAKVQAALLEAMAERQITVGGNTHKLDESLFVIATQNPIEEEGTYELPAAQLDRFALRVRIGWPEPTAESNMLELVLNERRSGNSYRPATELLSQISPEQLSTARAAVLKVHVSAPINEYIVRLVNATRHNGGTGHPIRQAVSPRGTLALAHLACARAWLEERDFVEPDDIKALAVDALSHRISIDHAAEHAGVSADALIQEIISTTPVS
ncbi:MAG: AAA family ATPase [Burkholderiaceae bacterium]